MSFLNFRLFVSFSVCVCVGMSLSSIGFICESVGLFVCLSVCLFVVCQFACLCVSLFVCLPICEFVCLSVCLFQLLGLNIESSMKPIRAEVLLPSKTTKIKERSIPRVGLDTDETNKCILTEIYYLGKCLVSQINNLTAF